MAEKKSTSEKGTSASKRAQEGHKRTWTRGASKRTLWSKIWARTGLRGKTLWDALQLLVVPLVLVVVGYYLTSAQQSSQQLQAATQQRELEEQKAQDTALLAYMGVMKDLLLDENLRNSGPDSSEVAVATAQTLLVLERMDPRHKTLVLHLLRDSHLIGKDGPLYYFENADLHNVNAKGMDLSTTFLSTADLRGANLRGANLSGDDLSGANLTNAHVGCYVEVTPTAIFNRCATLSGAALQAATLSNTDLSHADLSNAILINANLTSADLADADLSTAHLEGAYIVNEEGSKVLISNKELEEQARSLKGATMPHGQKYEDWVKDKEGSKEDAKNG